MTKLQNSHLVDDMNQDRLLVHTQNILHKIKVWLRGELSEVRKNPLYEDDDSRESALLDGRYECAEGLQTMIKQWEEEQ
tara:strand:- start:390 stop:626 length:237 start_codon:yes stop_codon:yes gene_type:complete